MKYVLDTHTHTIASGHAYNTLFEMIAQAKAQGLSLLSVTEHAPAMPGTCHIYYFHNYRAFRGRDFGLPVLLGAEVNIMDSDGTLDMDEDTLKSMDIKIASAHLPCLKTNNLKDNTQAYINTMKNPLIDIIGHPDDERIPIDYEALVDAAKKYNIALEVNNSSLSPNGFRKNARENQIAYLTLCKEYQVPITLGSDAHTLFEIANFSYIESVLEEVSFPDELILNTSVEKLMNHLNRNK